MFERGWRRALVEPVLAVLMIVGAVGCVRGPEPDPIASGPSIDQIVRRVKCDLVEALAPALADEKYSWLQTWTAQASLTFIVNNASTITPGATFTRPLPIVTIPGRVTNFGQSFNLGVGAGFNTTASHNETVTFSMSLEELKHEHRSDPGSAFCTYPELTDLHSELGLRGWIYDALSPTGNNPDQIRYLTPGHHKTSKSSAGPSGSSSSSSSSGAGTQGGGAALLTTQFISSEQIQERGFALDKAVRKLRPFRTETTDKEIQEAPKRDTLDTLNHQITVLLNEISNRAIDDPTAVVVTSVTGITPTGGPVLGGTPVTIIGANFSNLNDRTNSVTIGGRPATSVVVANDSTICAVAPPHSAAGKVDVVVKASGVEGTKIEGFTYTDAQIALDRRTGPPGGGTTVTITRKDGKDFTGNEQPTGVTFGGKEAANPTIAQHTITATTPPHDPGIVDVVVTMSDHMKNLTASNIFLYEGENRAICHAQASSRKRIIAYVDESLNHKIQRALFKSRKVVTLIENRMKAIPESQRKKTCTGTATDTDRFCSLNAVLQATKAVQDLLLALQLDPPIDAIGHQSQFIIVYNASISPSWTLVNFKGPSPSSGTGASTTKTLTHTLNIAMGPPGSPDVANTLGALQIGTTIGNSLGATGLTITVPP